MNTAFRARSFARVTTALVATTATLLLATVATADSAPTELLNVSYDVSRELFDSINPAFVESWRKKTGQQVKILQSHGGSSKQARAVADGLAADVVTFNQVTDIELLRRSGLVANDWQHRLPDNASPYYSLPVFVVRSGNPKKVKDWDDLVRPDVKPVLPNPKTSGNGRYSYLAAYAYALEKNGGNADKALQFVSTLLGNVPVFDTGGRGATTTFVERDIGDVLLTFESEVHAIRREYDKKTFESVTPSISLRADFPVAVVDKVVDRKGTRPLATAYLEYLFSPAGQAIIAKNHNRVHDTAAIAKYGSSFPAVKLIGIETLGGWDRVTKDHLSAGGILEKALLHSAAN